MLSCAKWRLLCEEDIGLATYTERYIAAFHIVMLLSHFSNDKPAKRLVHLNVVNCSQDRLAIYSV